ncbi:uncharacterized protein LOC114946423 [Nylanderia fulva]|uniref:uncharacterized protein LOC114946423 n=1 Tax=Nylanderia fulva TaxID=613905 RepID=UPI0010FB9120|nr:uncharacterized protein LOC114946423 [Nylanderia fulva]
MGARSVCNDHRTSASTARRGSLSIGFFFDRPAVEVKRSRKILAEDEQKRRKWTAHLIGVRHRFSVADPIGAYIYYHDGLIATAWSNKAASITGNRGINQSTGRRGRIKIDGCSRKRASSESQLSSEEPNHGRITSNPVQGDLAFLDDRGRSSEMTKQRRSRNSSIHALTSHTSFYYHSQNYTSVKSLRYYYIEEFVEFFSRFFKRSISHFIRCTRGENRLSRVYPASLKRIY